MAADCLKVRMKIQQKNVMIAKEDYDKMTAYLNRVTPEELDAAWSSIRDIDDGPEIIIDTPEIDGSARKCQEHVHPSDIQLVSVS